MNSDDTAAYAFVCPACGESLAVTDAMRAALLREGCVLCGTAVTDAAFTASQRAETP
ncbi:DUF7560 family zinc ribbon protein [Halobaculum sp. D14]|uniref:DUF7560 family zinc ribbon protein n=1 Tax=Halobaculum sp. D14 TaxID=3421642 RepID=UPI003EBE2F77